MGSMGVTSMTSMIACDSSFMIKSLYKFRIPGIDYDFSINTTHVALLIVSIFILVVAIRLIRQKHQIHRDFSRI